MSSGYQSLTEKEKQTLRLMVRGHDAKSMARQLGLSVHTVNERLRDARRKLQVSSSREAARLVFDAEAEVPQNLADKEFGEASASEDVAPRSDRRRTRRVALVIAGVVTMSVFLGLIALSVLSNEAATPTNEAAKSSVQAAAPAALNDSEIVRAARSWLELSDQGRWKDAWLATGSSFRKMNTVEKWTEVGKMARPHLGAVVSRTPLSVEGVPAPPAGVEVVKFRTTFANKADVIETVSLVREGSGWKVVGIYLD